MEGGSGSSECFSTGGKESELARLQRELDEKLAKINELKRERDEFKPRLETQQLSQQKAEAFKKLIEEYNCKRDEYNSLLPESSQGKE